MNPVKIRLLREARINNQNYNVDLETPAIGVLAAASKTPFATAFKVTMGIGLARAALFVGGVSIVMILYKILF